MHGFWPRGRSPSPAASPSRAAPSPSAAAASPTPAGLRKSVYSEDLALNLRLPLVRFIEGGGGSVAGSGGKKRGPTPGDPVFTRHRFVSIAQVLRNVPVVSAGVGAVAGLLLRPRATVAASDVNAELAPSNSELAIAAERM